MNFGKKTLRIACSYMIAVQLFGCSESFMKSAPRSKTTALVDLTTTVDAAGNVSAAFDPNSRSVQVLKLTSGTLKGAGVALPPGALSIPVSITVGEGETLASSGFSQSLGLSGNTITAAGPSVSFIPSENVQANSPFTLSIPVSTSGGLNLSNADSENLIVLYRWMKVADGVVSYSMGLIPRDEVTVSDSKVSFQTTKFGVFQIGISETKITEAVNKPTSEPPSLKADASNPLVGTWGQCYKDDHSGSSGGTGGGTGGEPPPTMDWTSGSTTPIPNNCSPSTKVELMTVVVGTPPPNGFLIGVSIDGGIPTTTNSVPFSSNLANHIVYNNTSATMDAGKILTLWAPKGCYFSTSSNGTAFSAFAVSNISDTISQCTSHNSSLYLTCDVTLNIGGWDFTGTGGTGTQTSGSNGGYGGLGQTEGTLYSNYDYVKFTSNSYNHVKQTFKSEDCSGTLVASVTELGTYELVTVDVPDTLPVNFTTTSSVGTIYDAESITSANENPDIFGCGLSDWVINSERNLTSSTCSKSNETEYNRVKITGSKMYFCDHGTGTDGSQSSSTEADRAPDCSQMKEDEYLDKQ